MVTPRFGQVKVLADFGLAKLLDGEEAGATGIHRTELTEVGSAVPRHGHLRSAPEQARGDRVDKRADIFSMGVLLYEMVTGIPGRSAVKAQSMCDTRFFTTRPGQWLSCAARAFPLTTTCRLWIAAMASDPALDRCQKMEDMRDDLRRGARRAGALTDGSQRRPQRGPRNRHAPRREAPVFPSRGPCAGSATLAPHRIAGHPLPQPGHADETGQPAKRRSPLSLIRKRKQLAILPFKNLSNDPASRVFMNSRWPTQWITELARVRSLVVRPSSVIARYRGQQVDPREVGHDLNVTAVLAAGFHPRGRAIWASLRNCWMRPRGRFFGVTGSTPRPPT